MARATGPLFSISAQGTLGNAITYQTNKGRNTIRTKPEPNNPKTLPQRIARAGVQIANEFWSQATDEQKEAWTSIAAHKWYTPYNALVGDVLARKAANQAPRIAPGGGAAWSSPILDSIAFTGLNGQIEVEAQFFDTLFLTDNIYVSLKANSAPPEGSFKHVIARLPLTETATTTITIRDIPPGTYHGEWFAAGTDGEIATSGISGAIVVA